MNKNLFYLVQNYFNFCRTKCLEFNAKLNKVNISYQKINIKITNFKKINL